MDIQKTMEFILEQQAAMTARQAEHEARMAAHEVRMAEHDKRMVKIDKRIDATTKLIQTGMRMLVQTDEKLKALAEAQLRAEARMGEIDARLDRLIKALSRGTNGHKKN